MNRRYTLMKLIKTLNYIKIRGYKYKLVTWLLQIFCQLCFFFCNLSVHISFAFLCTSIGLHAYLWSQWALQSWSFVYSSLYSPGTWPGPKPENALCKCSTHWIKKCFLLQMFNDHQFNNHRTYNASCFFNLMGACSLRIVFLVGSCKNKEFYFVFQKLVFFLKSFININSHKNPRSREKLSLFSFYRKGSWGTEVLRTCPSWRVE